jgi:hypothetical protein
VKSDDFKEYVVSAIHVVKSDKSLASDRERKQIYKIAIYIYIGLHHLIVINKNRFSSSCFKKNILDERDMLQDGLKSQA